MADDDFSPFSISCCLISSLTLLLILSWHSLRLLDKCIWESGFTLIHIRVRCRYIRTPPAFVCLCASVFTVTIVSSTFWFCHCRLFPSSFASFSMVITFIFVFFPALTVCRKEERHKSSIMSARTKSKRING